jgi:hypothetical protein
MHIAQLLFREARYGKHFLLAQKVVFLIVVTGHLCLLIKFFLNALLVLE